MTTLELLISRYLDGELTAGEEVRLEHLLRTSPEARTILREMTAIAHEARQVPSMSPPSQHVESHLFARLRAEGFGIVAPAAAERTAGPAARFGARSRRLVPTLLLVIAVAGSFLLSPELRTPEGVAPRGAATPFAALREQAPALAHGDVATIEHWIAVDRGPRHRETQGRGEAETLREARERALTAHSTPRRVLPLASGASEALTSIDAVDSAAVRPVPSASTPETNSAPELAVDSRETALAVGYQSPELPEVAPVETAPHRSLLSTSLRATASFIRMSDAVAKGVTASVDLELGGGHRLGLLAGRAASITEQRATNTLAVAAQVLGGDKKQSRRLARAEQSPSPYSVRLQQEWWLGVEYQYRMARLGPVDLGVGVRAGIGQEAWRAGIEVPVRLRVSNTVALEFSGSMTRVQPHSADRNASTVDSQADGYLYRTQETRTNFTTIGAEFGLRIALD